jgi:hypothetical protein
MEQMILLPADVRNEMGRNARIKIIREYDKQIVIDAYLKAIRQATA